MSIIPTVRCRSMGRTLDFYTTVLDFDHVEGERSDPGFCILEREGHHLFLSSHSGDGVFGQAVVVTTDDVDALFGRLRERGLETPDAPHAPRTPRTGDDRRAVPCCGEARVGRTGIGHPVGRLSRHSDHA